MSPHPFVAFFAVSSNAIMNRVSLCSAGVLLASLLCDPASAFVSCARTSFMRRARTNLGQIEASAKLPSSSSHDQVRVSGWQSRHCAHRQARGGGRRGGGMSMLEKAAGEKEHTYEVVFVRHGQSTWNKANRYVPSYLWYWRR